MPAFDPKIYGPVLQEVLRPERLPELGPGTPNDSLRAQLEALSVPSREAAFLSRQSSWDPFAFVDLCEAASTASCILLCRRIQQREWELLFDHCYRHAVGPAR